MRTTQTGQDLLAMKQLTRLELRRSRRPKLHERRLRKRLKQRGPQLAFGRLYRPGSRDFQSSVLMGATHSTCHGKRTYISREISVSDNCAECNSNSRVFSQDRFRAVGTGNRSGFDQHGVASSASARWRPPLSPGNARGLTLGVSLSRIPRDEPPC